jgi:hypothetical protein
MGMELWGHPCGSWPAAGSAIPGPRGERHFVSASSLDLVFVSVALKGKLEKKKKRIHQVL